MENKIFTIKGVIQEGWELTKLNIGFLIAYQIILFFLILLFNNFSQERPLFSLIDFVGWIIIVLGKMGFFNSALLLTKGLKPSFSQFYLNWRSLLSWIISSILFALMITIGLAFLIVPGLLIWATFGFFYFFILDKNLGPIAALEESMIATRGIRWHILGLFLVCFGLNLLGFICFGLGVLISFPVTLIAIAAVYRNITGQAQTSIQPDDIIPTASE